MFTEFCALAVALKPEFVTMGNIPQLVKYKGGCVFDNIYDRLVAAAYNVSWPRAKCEEFGVPQRRRRSILGGIGQMIYMPLVTSVVLVKPIKEFTCV